MKTLYIDCSSGASGDMLIGAFMDLGVDPKLITEAVRGLPFTVRDIGPKYVSKNGIRAIESVMAWDGDETTERRYVDIVALLEASQLAPKVRQRALGAFRILAEAEAKIHMSDIDEVHFHEVGSDDAIIDIVGACAALEDIGPDRVVVSPIATGRGTAESMHGTIPVPAPAVLEILAGAELYERGQRELITPTGAALLKSWADAFGAMPKLRIGAVGYGAGTADLEWPNVVRLIVGEEADDVRPTSSTELLETNIDDMSPELLPYVIERLLEAGALDAWATPVHMKKGRIGAVLSVLVERGASQAALDVIFRETTTFGVRVSQVDRAILDRKEIEVGVQGQRVRIKIGYRDGEIVTSSPEYEDVADVARTTGIPLKDVYRLALEQLPR
jgi:uncharacterized protein (TIGR00299 family) protein